MKKNRGQGGLVYSTDAGRMCPDCRQPIDACTCSTRSAPPAANSVVKVSRDRKGRAGKTVTVVQDIPLDPLSIARLCQTLKNGCGSGGTTRGQGIEIQGDHVEKIIGLLEKEGFKVKRVGG